MAKALASPAIKARRRRSSVGRLAVALERQAPLSKPRKRKRSKASAWLPRSCLRPSATCHADAHALRRPLPPSAAGPCSQLVDFEKAHAKMFDAQVCTLLRRPPRLPVGPLPWAASAMGR